MEDIISICDMRNTYTLSCRNCKYVGKMCDKVKHTYRVSKPYEILDKKEQYERMNIYND